MTKELTQEKKVKLEEMNEVYKEDCKRQVKDQLISEFDKVYDSQELSAENKDWAIRMAISILRKAQQLK